MKWFNIIIYPFVLGCYLIHKLFAFDYRQFLINITDPGYGINAIIGKIFNWETLKVIAAIILVFIFFSFLNAIIN